MIAAIVSAAWLLVLIHLGSGGEREWMLAGGLGMVVWAPTGLMAWLAARARAVGCVATRRTRLAFVGLTVLAGSPGLLWAVAFSAQLLEEGVREHPLPLHSAFDVLMHVAIFGPLVLLAAAFLGAIRAFRSGARGA